jgi:hypothetical protein
MKKTMMKAGLLALALGASSAANAEFNYSYIEGGFGEIDEGEALFAKGAFDLTKNFGLVGGIFIGDADPNVDVTAFEIGGQFHQPLKGNLSFHAGLQLLHIEAESSFTHPVFGTFKAKGDDTGFIANAGLRFQVQPKLQLEGDLKLSSNDMIDDGLGAEGAVRYYFDPKLSVAGGLAVDTELDGLFVSVRYDL